MAQPIDNTTLGIVDRQRLADAYAKAARGESLSRAEQQLLSRYEKDREERLRWQYYRSIPKKHWQRMSGRQVKVINEQAARYGLPLNGSTIDLTAVVAALHDFLAANARKLATDDDPLLSAGVSPALERYRQERARLAQLDRLERERELVSLDELMPQLDLMGSLIRNAGEELYARFGREAGDLICEALDEYGRRMEAMEVGEQEKRDAVPQ
jgi:hypothetical protein